MGNAKLKETADPKFAGTIHYHPLNGDGDEGIIVEFSYEHNGPKYDFDESKALGAMLCEEVIFVNSSASGRLLVICNDVFAWGCADCEELPMTEIENLYHMWKKDEEWGSAVWCMLQRKEMPQKPVEKRIRNGGLWDLDSLDLAANTTDDWLKYQLAVHLRGRAEPPAQPDPARVPLRSTLAQEASEEAEIKDGKL